MVEMCIIDPSYYPNLRAHEQERQFLTIGFKFLVLTGSFKELVK